jgi:hypothetical protein
MNTPNMELIREMNRAAKSNDPFKPVMTLNARESSECVEMLRDMGVKVIPMDKIAETLTEVL